MFRRVLWIAMLLVWLTGCVEASVSPQVDPNGGASQPPALASAAGQAQDPIAYSAPAEINLPAQTTVIDQTVVANEPAVSGETALLPPTAEASAPAASTADAAPQQAGAINPLTGLAVKDPATLALSPALVSITNFPVSARPQAGLSFSPFVFEMYVGEGMTRFLALFYGDYPVKGDDPSMALADDRIGPVRSGRLPYESLRTLYNGFLIMASASPNVKSSMGTYTNVFGTDDTDINSALIPATRLAEIASENPKRLGPDALNALTFSDSLPAGGQAGQSVWIPYSYLNQVFWRYDSPSGAYHRFQDNADGVTFTQTTDRLNGDPLTYENVVVLFADHQAKAETLIDIDLMYIKRMPALLFRDGQMYKIYWTTANGAYERSTGLVRPIRFVDAQGNPFPLKPGQTWVEIVQAYTPYNETIESETYFDLKHKTSPGSGNWAIQFMATTPE